jgi:hypothetical protein
MLTHLIHERRHLDSGHDRLKAFITSLGAGSFDGLLDGIRGEDSEDNR